MAYEVLARKWRPQTFADVVGQQHIIKTLQNELLQNRMAHAYLFVGPRGIGKTTIARIFAKAMNCHKAPTAEPCCQCQSCLDITTGNNLDLIEIDGASNNKVEDIHQLRAEVLYSPVNSKFKIYIIDEVHMLSTAAWNALLKTIEEPPAHAKFLFATTEAHKVIPTVVSRCQRFDLQRITFQLITEQLKKITVTENIKITDDAIEAIARAADGGMRDAQSLLDQMIAFASSEQETITGEQVLAIFGLTGIAEMEKLIIAILQNDKPGMIAGIHQLAGQGKNLEKLFEDILAFLRGVQICLILDDPASILEIGNDIIQLYKRVGATTDANTVQKLLEYLSPVSRVLHDALNKQVFLETTILKGMRMTHAVEIETLIARLNQLRKGEDLLELEKIPPATPIQTAPPAPAAPPVKQEALPAAPPPVVQPVTPVSAAPVTQQGTSIPATVTAAPPVEKNDLPVTPATLQPVPEITVTQAESPPATPEPQSGVSPEVFLSSTTAGVLSLEDPLKKNDELMPPVPELSELLTAATQNQPLLLTPKTQAERDADISSPAPLKPEAIEILPAEEPSPAVLPQSIAFESEPAPQELIAPEQTPEAAAEEVSEQKIVLLENPKLETPPLDPKTHSPESLWHALILEMDHCKQPILKAYMQEGKPESLIGGTLTVTYDEDSESFYITELQKEKHLLELRLKKLTGSDGAALNIISKRGITSPHDIIHQRVQDLAEIRKRAENNLFVKDTIDLFNGEIVDVRG